MSHCHYHGGQYSRLEQHVEGSDYRRVVAGAAYGAMAHATSVVFLNPGMSTETFWVSYAQFMQAAAKDLGLDLRVRYSERRYGVDFRRLSALGKPGTYRYPFSLQLLMQ